MTPIATRILAIASEHAEYPGARQTTLRGQGIVDAVLHCFTDECLADLLKLRAEESDLKNGPHYSPPGTTSSAAAPKESAS